MGSNQSITAKLRYLKLFFWSSWSLIWKKTDMERMNVKINVQIMCLTHKGMFNSEERGLFLRKISCLAPSRSVPNRRKKSICLIILICMNVEYICTNIIWTCMYLFDKYVTLWRRIIYVILSVQKVGGIVQSVQRPGTGWTAEGSELESQ
jgi:hypothetical protein